jgi:hypothetical protein
MSNPTYPFRHDPIKLVVMKEYRLTAWSEPRAPFSGTVYRRMLTDMSHRYMSVSQLASSSGIRRHDIEQFLNSLESRGLLLERELFLSDTVLNSTSSVGDWLRRKLNLSNGSR